MENITINKVSDLEAEIVEVVPEQVIPAREIKRTVTLKVLKQELEIEKATLESAKESKQGDVEMFNTAMARHDEIIAKAKAVKDNLVARIDAIKAQGVIEEVVAPVVEEPVI